MSVTKSKATSLMVVALLLAVACQTAGPSNPSEPDPSATGAPSQTTGQQSTVVPDCEVAPGPFIVGAEELAAMTLPVDELGANYQGWRFDSGFGGFTSNLDAASFSGFHDTACADYKRFGRLVGYSGMYRRPTGGFTFMQTAVTLFRDSAGAARAFAKGNDDLKALVGKPQGDETFLSAVEFAVPSLGDEALDLFLQGDKSDLTRVTFRRGRFTAWANTKRDDHKDVREEVKAFATRLDARISAVLRGEIDPYRSPRPTRIAAEQLTPLPLRVADLGPDYATFEQDAFETEFHSNEAFADSYQGTTIDGMLRNIFGDTGRITGETVGLTSWDARAKQLGIGYFSSGTHLFSTSAGAGRYPALFRDAEATMVARAAGGQTGSVDSEGVPGLGDSALLMATRYSNGQTRTRILFVRGRVVGDIYVYRFDNQDTRAEITAYARELDRRIQSVPSQ